MADEPALRSKSTGDATNDLPVLEPEPEPEPLRPAADASSVTVST